MISFHLATEADQARLELFIAQHWSANHIFVERPEVFAWQHLQTEPSGHDGPRRFNMVFAEADGAVVGVLGFIPMGRFSEPLADRDIMLAIWKATDDAPPGVGLGLLKFLQSRCQPRLIGAIGTSEMVRPIYKALKYQTGMLEHWALFDPERRGATVIASGVPDTAFDTAESQSTVELVPAVEFNGVAEIVNRLGGRHLPQKDWRYLEARFLEHPWYDYDVEVVVDSDDPVAVAVWRVVRTAEAAVLRIVDIVGDTGWLARGREPLIRAVRQRGAEYIDVTHFGIDDSALSKAGFVSPAAYPELVLPNYFSPFEARNIELGFAFRRYSSELPVVLFRGDSDQDRPNLVNDVGDAPG